ncbi:MAG: hypothetical protein ACLP0J_05460 [Solirubrobacteraceae bacterium]
MTGPRWSLSVGGRLVIDGEAIMVTAVDGADVRGFAGRGEPVRFVLTRVEPEPIQTSDQESRFGLVLLDAGALSDRQLRAAAELLAHLNEASFGYRSGDPGRPSPGEPRERFDPGRTTLRDRLEAKATELGCSVETLRRRRRMVQRCGLVGLVDARHSRSVTGADVDARLGDAIIAEACELENASDVRKMQFRSRVASRLARETGEPLVLPSTRPTFNRIVDEVLASTRLFRLLAKSATARKPRRVTCSGRWSRSAPGSSSRSTPRALTCSRSTRSRSSGWDWI